MKIAIVFIFVLMGTLNLSAYYPEDMNSTLTRIAFGSCSHQERPQTYWKTIAAQRPDLWIWMGDTVYADTDKPEKMAKTYNKMFNNRRYRVFRESIPMIGTWDDHDYGKNNGGSEYPMKAQAQQLFLNFLEEPEASPRRKHEGVYDAYTFGPDGKQVKIIMIDDRYFAKENDLLGAQQWAWLQKELLESHAQFNIIVSGIQVISEEHRFEKWANFPATRKALFDFVAEHKIKNLFFLSGDRHISEVSQENVKGLPYPLVDITSSGLTHSYNRFAGEPNRHRIGEVVSERSFGMLLIDWKTMSVAAEFCDMNGECKQVHTLTF